MVKLTKAQRKALFKVFQRDFPGWVTPFKRMGADPRMLNAHAGYIEIKVPSLQWRRFRKTVTPYFDNSGCVMVPWRGMWLGIETDGYTHS
jgi:hypothetical protein